MNSNPITINEEPTNTLLQEELSSDNLTTLFSKVDMLLNKSYLPIIKDCDIINSGISEPDFKELNKHIRFFEITRIVLNKNENMRDKLVSVFSAVGTCNASLLFLIQGRGDDVSIFMGIKTDDFSDYTETYNAQQILEKNIKGNFSGTETKIIRYEDLEDNVYKKVFPDDAYVASVSAVARQRTEHENKDRNFIQGIEKFIDSMQGEEYSLLVIADAISQTDLDNTRRGLENLYSALMPYSGSSVAIGKNEMKAVGKSISETVTKTITEGFSNSKSKGKNRGDTFNPLAILGAFGMVAGSVITGLPAAVMARLTAATMLGGVLGFNSGENENDSITNQNNSSDSKAKTEASTENHSIGNSESCQIQFENHTIKRILKKIEELLKRYDACADIGMWSCAAYCIADKKHIAQTVASTYQSLIRGKDSALEENCITAWNKEKSKDIINFLKRMKHPSLGKKNTIGFTPAMIVSSAELAIHAGLPNHSVPGIPVIECAEFGRTIASYDEHEKNEQGEITLGHYFYMNHEDTREVRLDVKNFCSHTFITGSTGSGKSTAVYTMLHELNECKSNEKSINFLVVEPAKGEYKHIFGKRQLCDGTPYGIADVYGTNAEYAKLLKINPFSFPKEIAVVEHIERLVEIFNVCWVMYAAMPQVLKDAVTKSYEDTGWNLETSKNTIFGETAWEKQYFPTFSDVVRNIKKILDSSDYSSDTKGDYKGALETRLKSMTNGSNGQIFVADELSSEKLFEENVIVDLSRLGSTETRSLIMGILVLKLQEYRMSQSVQGKISMDSDLRHITVLEEAHHLLKRTSTEQNAEIANPLGKSVEMLTNAIAEMRTYGEGFIVADQSPALLDMAVIRNTNTKIIMRLPDISDRELVGKAANLNNDQIVELAKLPRGVAAVYQNEWIQPILCKIKKNEELAESLTDEKDKVYSYTKNGDENKKEEDVSEARKAIAAKIVYFPQIDFAEIENFVKVAKLSVYDAIRIKQYYENPHDEIDFLEISPLIALLYPEFLQVEEAKSVEQIRDAVEKKIHVEIADEPTLALELLRCILYEIFYNRKHCPEELEKLIK